LPAPLFEDKVIDYILELADVTDNKVDRETLLAEDDDSGGRPQTGKSKKKTKSKKAD
jgi:trigger factor